MMNESNEQFTIENVDLNIKSKFTGIKESNKI